MTQKTSLIQPRPTCASSSACLPVFTSYSAPDNSILSHGMDSSSFPFFANVTSVSEILTNFTQITQLFQGGPYIQLFQEALLEPPLQTTSISYASVHSPSLTFCTSSLIFWQNRLQEASREMLLILVLQQAHDTNSLRSHGLQLTRLLCQWDSPDKNTDISNHSLLQGIFLTQGSNLGSPALQADSLPFEPAGIYMEDMQ